MKGLTTRIVILFIIINRLMVEIGLAKPRFLITRSRSKNNHAAIRHSPQSYKPDGNEVSLLKIGEGIEQLIISKSEGQLWW